MNGAGPQPGAVPEFAAVDAARFRETIRPTGRPAVMRGLAADWPLVAAGRHGGAGLREALGAAYSGAPIHAFRAEPAAGGRLHYTDRLDALNFRREQTRLDTLLDELVAQAGSPSADTLYAGSLPLPVIAPAIAAANRLDGFIHAETVLHSLWLGTKARVGVHYDQTENIAVVVAGRRRFTLFPTQCLNDLYFGPLDLTPAGQPVSLVDVAAPDFDRFPRYAQALGHAQVAELGPGDALYLPALWLHGVEALDPINALVNFWWTAAPPWFGNPFHTLLHALLSLGSLPQAERDRWRAVFEYWVFRSDGGGPGHLDAAALGLAGPLDREGATRLRAILAQAFSA